MNAQELGDMPAFPLPVVLDSNGQPRVHPHPYNKGMTVRDVSTLVMMAAFRIAVGPQAPPRAFAELAERDTHALLALLAKDAE